MPVSQAHISLPDRYTVVRHIASGGMASVWEAHDSVLGRDVAVKVLAGPYAADEVARSRFTREARAAARLSNHPHVVTVYDAGEQDGDAYLVMALYGGGTVGDRLKAAGGGGIEPDTALRWLGDAAGALDAAHAEGVVHRDVKPGNLLLDDHERVAVGDFGIATVAWASSVTQTGFVVGTMAYLSPEQRAGEVATPASDRYALGVVAHELLTGARPDGAISAGLAPGAAEVLRAATATDPAARPASCADLVTRLAGALDVGEPTTVVPLPATAQTAAARPRAGAAVAVAPREPRQPHARTPAPARGRSGGRSHGRALALAAVVIVGAGIAAIAAFSGGGDNTASTRATTTPRTATSGARAPAPASPQKTATTQAPAQTAPSPGALSPAEAAKLNTSGHALVQNGQVQAGIEQLQRAAQALSANPNDINYAYALFNLGQALRMAGRPQEAVDALQRRLQVNGTDQRATVEHELTLAQQALGQSPGTPGAAPPGKGHDKPKKQDGGGD